MRLNPVAAATAVCSVSLLVASCGSFGGGDPLNEVLVPDRIAASYDDLCKSGEDGTRGPGQGTVEGLTSIGSATPTSQVEATLRSLYSWCKSGGGYVIPADQAALVNSVAVERGYQMDESVVSLTTGPVPELDARTLASHGITPGSGEIREVAERAWDTPGGDGQPVADQATDPEMRMLWLDLVANGEAERVEEVVGPRVVYLYRNAAVLAGIKVG